MPYIIKTYTVDRERHGVGWPAFPTRTAVATLEEARQRVFEIAEPHGYAIAVPAVDIVREVGHPDPNRAGDVSGGTIGPLPDGTVIEVRRVDWMDFERLVVPGPVAAIIPITTFDDDDYRDSLIRAFNAA